MDSSDLNILRMSSAEEYFLINLMKIKGCKGYSGTNYTIRGILLHKLNDANKLMVSASQIHTKSMALSPCWVCVLLISP